MLRGTILIVVLTLLCLPASGCGDAQKTETAGIGRSCDHDDDCEQGQACVVTSRTADAGELTTCQIPCRSTNDCPDGYRCRSGSQEAPTAICVKED